MIDEKRWSLIAYKSVFDLHTRYDCPQLDGFRTGDKLSDKCN